MSEQRPGMIPGDVVFRVRVKNHPTFQRQGNDLHMEVSMSLKEALTGYKLTITHLDGREVVVEDKGVTGPYDIKRVEGEGMPLHDVPSQKGDLYVKIKIVFPKQISKEQTEYVKNTNW